MRKKVIAIGLFLLLPLVAGAQQGVYRYVDDEGNVHYTDTPPPDASEYPKEVKNPEGVTIAEIEGKKTEEQLRAEKEAEELRMQQELQLRADRALLATYLSVDEIEMHRDRRVELFQAQSKVTELYLRNLRRRLDQLQSEAGRYKPYSSDPGAPQIDPELVEDIETTKATIDRHEENLLDYKNKEQEIKDRFAGDITRFVALKGLDT